MIDFLLMMAELAITFFIIIGCVRIIGNKELRESTPVDFAYMVLMASMAWDLVLEDQYNLIHITVAILSFTSVYFVFDWLTFRFKGFERVFIGKPMKLIEDGKVNEKALKRHRISDHELDALMRENGIFDVKDVKVAYVEIDGGISIKNKDD